MPVSIMIFSLQTYNHLTFSVGLAMSNVGLAMSSLGIFSGKLHTWDLLATETLSYIREFMIEL